MYIHTALCTDHDDVRDGDERAGDVEGQLSITVYIYIYIYI